MAVEAGALSSKMEKMARKMLLACDVSSSPICRDSDSAPSKIPLHLRAGSRRRKKKHERRPCTPRNKPISRTEIDISGPKTRHQITEIGE